MKVRFSTYVLMYLLSIIIFTSNASFAGMTQNHIYNIVESSPPLSFPFPTDLNQFIAQQDQMRIQLRKQLNLYPWPDRCPLNAQIKGTIDSSDYFIQKIVFQSRPSMWVTGNLYIPKNVSYPVPVVLHAHGHASEGKAAGNYQALNISLAKYGIAVFAIDGYGYGERDYTGHGFLTGREMAWSYLTGDHLQGLMVWDNIRAIDYLISRTDIIDPSKIGMTGGSGGCIQTLYTVAIDTRIACAVYGYATTDFKGLIQTGASHCIDAYVPNLRRYFDYKDLIAMFCPRPARMVNGITDPEFVIDGARRTYNAVKPYYEFFNRNNSYYIHLDEYNEGHGFSQLKRQSAIGWFMYHLKGIGDCSPIPESVDTIRTEQELACGLPVESTATVDSITYESALTIPTTSGYFLTVQEFYSYKDYMKNVIRNELLGYDIYNTTKCALNPTVVTHADMGSYWKDTVKFNSESDIQLTGYLYYRKGATNSPVIICVPKSSDGQTDNITRFIESGYVVLELNVRQGESALVASQWGGDWGDSEYVSFCDGQLLGKSLFGMKVWDVLRAIDYVTTRTDLVDIEHIGLMGKDTYGSLYCLYAGILDERVKSIVLPEIIATYKADEPGKWYDWNYVIYLPFILKYANITQLTSLIAPRYVMVSNPVNTLNQPVDNTRINTEFDQCKSIYQLLNQQPNFILTTTGYLDTYIGFFNNTIVSTATATKIVIKAEPSLIAAEPTATSDIIANICDDTNNLVTNTTATVTFSLVGVGTLEGTNPVDTQRGIATIVYRAGTSSGTAIITATSNGLLQSSVTIITVINSAPNPPHTLRCNGQDNPSGINNWYPTLSWIFSDNDTNDLQSAYRLLVTDNIQKLESGTGDIWDTGKIISTMTTVTYSGEPLQYYTTYYWKVATWDMANSQSPYSTIASFSMQVNPSEIPLLSLSVTTLEFGNVDLGKVATLTFEITNINGGTLSGTITSDKEWIRISPTNFVGNKHVINVSVDNGVLNKSEGQYSGIITVTSNGGTATVDVIMTATCILVKPNPYNPDKGLLTFFGNGIIPDKTTIKIYTLSGELVKTLYSSINPAQKIAQEITWDGKNEEGYTVTSGIYLYTYQSPTEKGIGKFTVITR